VSLDKRTGRWEARDTIGGKRTSLGLFGSEEEAARAWDRMRLWRCMADGKKTEEVEDELNFPLSDYSDAEVTALQGCTQEGVINKLRRAEERVASQSSKYRGVTLVKSTGRWKAQCYIGGKKTSLGYFGSEEEAARAFDRMMLWSCKAGGKKKEEVEVEVLLNFPLSEYSEDEVTAAAAAAPGRGRDPHAAGPRIRRRHERQPPRVRHLLPRVRRRRRHGRRRASHVLAVSAREAVRRVRPARVEGALQAAPVPVVQVEDRLLPAPPEAVRVVE
jgi:hypothetical protein